MWWTVVSVSDQNPPAMYQQIKSIILEYLFALSIFYIYNYLVWFETKLRVAIFFQWIKLTLNCLERNCNYEARNNTKRQHSEVAKLYSSCNSCRKHLWREYYKYMYGLWWEENHININMTEKRKSALCWGAK